MMIDIRKNKLKAVFIPLFIVASMWCVQTVCLSISVFYLQIIIALFFGICIAFTGVWVGVRQLGYGLNLFVIWSLALIFIKELFSQIQAFGEHQPFQLWRSTFYYDKPMIVLVLWSAVFSVCVCLRLLCNGDVDTQQRRQQYQSFFSSVIAVFRIYYLFLLFYVFFIYRMAQGASVNSDTLNFIPFRMVVSYFQGEHAASYQNLIIFFGNVFLFLPMGFYFCWKHAGWGRRLWLAPVVFSCFIEITQLLTQLGQCDIDDVLLNCLGFYLGMWLKMGLDAIRRKRTSNGEMTIFY